MIIDEQRNPQDLGLYVVIGLFGTAAIAKTWSSEPDYWEQEIAAVGSGLDDLGIPDVPTIPGWYRWYGTVKTYGPDMEGDYDACYKGKWFRIAALEQ